MKKLLSTSYSTGAFNVAMLVLRLGAGILMMSHGYDKLIHFTDLKAHFGGYFGMSGTVALLLVVFAEFFCALFIVLGLFTRMACIPLVISSSVALFKAHGGDLFGKGEMITLFLICFLVILLLGPGKVSVDSMTGK